MTDNEKFGEVETQTLAVEERKKSRSKKIGLLGNYADTDETRFLLTPEACGMLCSGGYTVKMEADAGVDISFSDENYAEYGVEIVTRDEALQSDKVLSYAPINKEDILKMKDGAILLCMMDNSLFDKQIIETLLKKNITLGCFDNMLSYNSMPVFADIIAEINGLASMVYVQDYLSFLGGGKGVLLSSVAGLNPCEILVIGDGTDVYAACKAGIRAGAYVTLMINDVSALMNARQEVGFGLNTNMIHPRVLYNKVKSADVILLGRCTREFELPKKLSLAMKESVYILDMQKQSPSVTVPRTVAMALSNVLVNFFDEMQMKDGFDSMVATTSGVQCGIVTYKGKLVDKLIGSYLGLPAVDIKMMLAPIN